MFTDFNKNTFDRVETTKRNFIVKEFASKEEAVLFVKEFWNAMPHSNALTLPKDDEEWMDELTAGDRTKISQGVLPGVKGKCIVRISGNHQALSQEAMLWLKKKGLV